METAHSLLPVLYMCTCWSTALNQTKCYSKCEYYYNKELFDYNDLSSPSDITALDQKHVIASIIATYW